MDDHEKRMLIRGMSIANGLLVIRYYRNNTEQIQEFSDGRQRAKNDHFQSLK
jgi:hypothetical protein